MHKKYLIIKLLLLCFIVGSIENCNTSAICKTGSLSLTNERYPTYNESDSTESAMSDSLLFSYNDTPFDIYDDTVFFENYADRNLCFHRCKIYLNGKKIFCFDNVAAFEQILYVQVKGKNYLYFYPSFFNNEDTDSVSVPVVRAWEDCGVLIEFREQDSYLIRISVAFVDEVHYLHISELSSFVTDTLEVNYKNCLNYNTKDIN